MPRLSVAVSVRPDFETATYVGSLVLRRAVDRWVGRGYTITDLPGDRAVREEVLKALTTDDPIFVFGVGHGNETTYTGQGYDKIFWSCDSGELADRVVYLLSCITAAELGPDTVDKGARCYIGYSETFGWVMERVQDPLADRYAKSFFEPVLELIYRLIDGATAEDAFKASIDRWNYWIDYWSRSTDPAAPAVLQWLLQDRDSQKLIGDRTATVTTPPPLTTYLIPAVLGSIPVLVTLGISIYSELTKKPPVAV